MDALADKRRVEVPRDDVGNVIMSREGKNWKDNKNRVDVSAFD